MRSKREHYQAKAYDRLLNEIRNPENLATVREFLTTRQAKDSALATQVNYLRSFVALETHLAARPFRTATANDLSGLFAALQREKKAATVSFYSKALLAFYRWVLGDEPMKRTFRDAFRVPEAEGRTLIVTDDEFAAMLRACHGTQDRGLNWLLRDGGIRLGEAYVANVTDLTFDADGGVTLDLTRKNLKTKPSRRLIYMARAGPILKALIAEHPTPNDPEPPLFAHYREPLRGQRMEHADLDGMIRRARMRSGLGKNITAHVYRHTRATELNRNGWNEQKIKRYMGWSKTSRMNAKYTHLVDDDIRSEVRRDAGYTDPIPSTVASVLPSTVPVPTQDSVAFAQAFGLAWEIAHRDPIRTPAPQPPTTAPSGD